MKVLRQRYARWFLTLTSTLEHTSPKPMISRMKVFLILTIPTTVRARHVTPVVERTEERGFASRNHPWNCVKMGAHFAGQTCPDGTKGHGEPP